MIGLFCWFVVDTVIVTSWMIYLGKCSNLHYELTAETTTRNVKNVKSQSPRHWSVSQSAEFNKYAFLSK